MAKLLHLVFAVWKTDRPFAPPQTPTPEAAPTAPTAPEKAVGRKGRRPQITIKQVLRELQWWDCLKVEGPQRRGPCPIHGSTHPRSRSFSVHPQKNIFHCFARDCGAHGNVLDLWAQKHRLTLFQAALDLTKRFGLTPGTEKRNP